MTHRYEAFGVTIGSNHPLAGLTPSEASGVDIEVDFAEGRAPLTDRAAAVATGARGWAAVRAGEDGERMLLFAADGGASAWSMRVSGDGRSIEVRWRGPVQLADVAAFVEVSGLPTALTLQGVPLLHGCAIDTGGSAFVALGAGGAGKSTLAAVAASRGYAVLTDDIAALGAADDGVVVHAGGSLLRMNEDTARALGRDPAELGRAFVTPALPRKLVAPLPPSNGGGPRRLASIFVLGERRPGTAGVARLGPAAALPALLGNTFGDRAVDARVRARLLPFWTRLAREVPVHAVDPPDDLAAVASLVDALAAAAARDGR